MDKAIYPGLWADPVLKEFFNWSTTIVQEKSLDLNNTVSMSV